MLFKNIMWKLIDRILQKKKKAVQKILICKLYKVI